jgi:hypothetical protein
LYNPGTERQSERTEDWALSPDGKKLFDQEWGKRADGQEQRSKLVYDKVPCADAKQPKTHRTETEVVSPEENTSAARGAEHAIRR